MSSIEKLVRAVEALKVFSSTTISAAESSNLAKLAGGIVGGVSMPKKDATLSTKEKMINCNLIADCVCSPSVRNSADFPKFLGIAVETFLVLCDDDDSNMKIVADECLNRVIRTLMESNLGRLQIELYKELKKNGPSRSLRAALWRFAELCHLIRPQKCRPYIVNLVPCLTRICHRPEELVQDCLAAAMHKLCPVLLSFTTDIEAKMLLKSFLPNTRSSSAVTRRTAAVCLTLICQHSRKPVTFSLWLLNALLDSLVPVEETSDIATILGVLLSLRHLIGLLFDAKVLEAVSSSGRRLKGSFGSKFAEADAKLSLRQMIKILEVLLFYTGHRDHNVVTASLEALHQFLKHSPPSLTSVLATRGGVGRMNIQEKLEPSQRLDSSRRLASVDDDGGGVSVSEATPDDEIDTSGSDDMMQMTEGSIRSDLDDSAPALALDLDDDQLSKEIPAPDIDKSEPKLSAEDPSQSLMTGAAEYSGVDIPESVILSPSSSNDTLSSAAVTKPPVGAQGVASCSINTGDRQSIASDDSGGEGEGEGGNLFPPSPLRDGEIGSLDDNEVPLVYMVRVLSSRFLLTGYQNGLIADGRVRVSVKALALNCIACVLDVYPKAFLRKLHKTSSEPGELQDVREVLMYVNHSDQQLKGNTCTVIGHLTRAALTEGRGRLNQWMRTELDKDVCTLEDLVLPLVTVLEDESSVASRCAVAALQICLPAVLESEEAYLAVHIILALLKVKTSSYWLVKAELVELFANTDFKIVDYLEGLDSTSQYIGAHRYLNKLDLQQHVLKEVFLVLMSDEDPRVRNATASALVRLIRRLYFSSDNPLMDSVTSRAHELTEQHLGSICDECLTGSSSPFTTSDSVQMRGVGGVSLPVNVNSSLCTVVMMIQSNLVKSGNKNVIIGCMRSLSVLSEHYPVTQSPSAWGCAPLPVSSSHANNTAKPSTTSGSSSGTVDSASVGISCAAGPLSVCLAYMTSSFITLDISAHIDALTLSGNLLTGAALCCLQSVDEVVGQVEPLRWACITDRVIASYADELLTHIARVLNIVYHVLDDQQPGPSPSKPLLSALPNPPSLSPIRRKARIGVNKDEPSSSPAATAEKSVKPPVKEGVREGEREKVKREGLGQFYEHPHYVKLYEILKAAYASYKISLDLSASEKFIQLMRVSLQVLADLLEVASVVEIGKHAEELLGYLKVIIVEEPTKAILCVRQLLKAIFGTNTSGQLEPKTTPTSPLAQQRRGGCLGSPRKQSGLYHGCLNSPYTQFTQSLAGSMHRASTSPQDHEESSSVIGWLKKKAEKKLSSVLKQTSKTDRSSVASYIRLFEPLVIKSLKQYTVTSHVQLQQQVLDLLAQLVQLRVNYCLLDSDQIFVGYVIKQFEYIEEGQMRNADQLIRHMFNFLVLLSYEKYHSKVVIALPKVIQLCDGIMASGQDPATHAIPGLQCLVHDLFIMRGVNKSEISKDLDTQREVVISMLLRLLQHNQMMELFIVVLHQCRREGDDKWKRLSRQVTDMILPLLETQQVNVDSIESLDVLDRLFESVTPSVFRPVDILLKVLFSPPPDLSTMQGLQRWLALVLAILRVIMCQSKEEAILGRLQELGLDIQIYSDTVRKHRDRRISVEQLIGTKSLVTDVSATGREEEIRATRERKKNGGSEEVFARFLLQVLGVVSSALSEEMTSLMTSRHSSLYISQLLSRLLLYVTHMFQSGNYRRVALSTMSLIRKCSGSSAVRNTGASSVTNVVCSAESEEFYSIDKINESFIQISRAQPTLMLQWCNILIQLNYCDLAWWSRVFHSKTLPQSTSRSGDEGTEHVSGSESVSGVSGVGMNEEIVRRGGLIVFCDYICENVTETELLSWLIKHHVSDLFSLSNEPPVQDLIAAVHRNATSSAQFIEALDSIGDTIKKLSPSSVKKILQCIENTHQSVSAAMLRLLLDKFLTCRYLALSRLADSIACRRLELLLAENLQDEERVSVEDAEILLKLLQDELLVKRHGRLLSLVHKLHRAVTSSSPNKELTSDPLSIDENLEHCDITGIDINQDWYLSVIREHCFTGRIVCKQISHLLQHLNYSMILSLIIDSNCSLTLLESCISRGTVLSIREYHESGPQSPDHLINPLLKAGQFALLRHINGVINSLPHPYTVIDYSVTCPNLKSTNQYRDNMMRLFTDEQWTHNIVCLTKALAAYLHSIDSVPSKRTIPEESVRDIVRFGTLMMDLLQWMVCGCDAVRPSSDVILSAVKCYSMILNNEQLSALLDLNEFIPLICSVITSTYRIVCSFVVLPGQRLADFPHQENNDDQLPSARLDDQYHAVTACDHISELIHSLGSHFSPENINKKIPMFLVQPLRCLIINLGRQSVVNSYARTPPLVWKLGWMPSPSGDMRTRLPALPLDYLREKDVLSDFITRINCLGWTSRQQFEETWMSLLGVLDPISLGSRLDEQTEQLSPEAVSILRKQNALCCVHDSVMGSISTDPCTTMQPVRPLASALLACCPALLRLPEETIERTQCQVLALRAITTLLLQSMLAPKSGHPALSAFEFSPRDRPLSFLQTGSGKKFAGVRWLVEGEMRRSIQQISASRSDDQCTTLILSESKILDTLLVGNLERQIGDESFQPGQLSVESIWSFVGMTDPSLVQGLSQDSGSETDTSSSGVESPMSQRRGAAPLQLPEKVPRSATLNGLDIHSCIQFLLELYSSTLSFNMMSNIPLMLLNETIRSLVYLSDVFTERTQYDWMLGVLLEVYRCHPAEDELVANYLVLGIAKAAAIVAIDLTTAERVVRMIETSLRSTHLPTKVSALYGSLYLLESSATDTISLLLPVLSDYLLRSLNSFSPTTIHSEKHVLVMWATAFYLKENYATQLKDNEFSSKMLQLCAGVVGVQYDSVPLSVYLSVMRGLERLQLSGTLTLQESEAIAKLSIDRFKHQNPQRSVAALGLLLTSLYAGLPAATSLAADASQGRDPDLSPELMYDPEALMVILERVSVMFERFRKGLPHEAELISRVLPSVLVDFCPAQDIMNKVIGEFLYTHQPHPQLMAHVVFNVFDRLMRSGQHALVCNWVLLSLSNITQRTPISMAIWSLTCFFVSASSSHWLHCLMPLVMSRMGRMELIDRQLFSLSALDFRSNLKSDADVRAFSAVFQTVSQPGTPYVHLLQLCGASATQKPSTH